MYISPYSMYISRRPSRRDFDPSLPTTVCEVATPQERARGRADQRHVIHSGRAPPLRLHLMVHVSCFEPKAPCARFAAPPLTSAPPEPHPRRPQQPAPLLHRRPGVVHCVASLVLCDPAERHVWRHEPRMPPHDHTVFHSGDCVRCVPFRAPGKGGGRIYQR